MTPETLSLEALRSFDPAAKERGTEWRFLCPFCHEERGGRRGNRDLAVSGGSGAWLCHRCKRSGLLSEFHTKPQTRYAPVPFYARRGPIAPERRLDGDSGRSGSHHGINDPRGSGAPVKANLEANSEDEARRRRRWAQLMAGMMLATRHEAVREYLRRRGLGSDFARGAWAHEAAALGQSGPFAVFPFYAPGGLGPYGEDEPVALALRQIEGSKRRTYKAHEGGPHGGMFGSPLAWDAATVAVAITEAPIDALSLEAAGLPAYALGGTSLPETALAALSGRRVVIALDSDGPGKEAAVKLSAALAAAGIGGKRITPPAPFKDWNEALTAFGPAALSGALAAALPAGWVTAVKEAAGPDPRARNLLGGETP